MATPVVLSAVASVPAAQFSTLAERLPGPVMLPLVNARVLTLSVPNSPSVPPFTVKVVPGPKVETSARLPPKLSTPPAMLKFSLLFNVLTLLVPDAAL